MLMGLYKSGAYYTCYLYLKNEEWNKIKNNALNNKKPFYYLTANKVRDPFHKLRLLASLRIKNT